MQPSVDAICPIGGWVLTVIFTFRAPSPCRRVIE